MNRRLTFVTALVFCIGIAQIASVSIAQSPSISAADEIRLREIEQLVVELPNDSIGSLSTLTSEEAKAWEMKRSELERQRLVKIRSEPGIGPYLVILADRYLDKQNRDGLPMIMQAIASRADISTADIDRFVERASAIISNSNLIPQPYGDDFLVGMASVMASHPSPKAEALLTKMLRLRDDYTGIPLKLAAGEALATCGSSQALPDMDAASKWVTAFAAKSGDMARVEQARKLETYRNSLEKRQLSSQASKTNGLPSKPSIHLHEKSNQRKPIAQSSRVIIIALMVLVTIGLLWLLLKNRK